jgi:hypothetical protein
MASGFHLSRIAPDSAELDGETTKLDDTKIGWLRVIFHGNIRWARPAYPKGCFTPPTKAFLDKYREKLGVWVAPQWSSNDDEQSCHLVWTAFSPFGAQVLPPDVEAGFPAKQFFYTANWELLVDDEGTVDARYVDNDKPDGDPKEYPMRFRVDKADGGKLSVALDVDGEKTTLDLTGFDKETVLTLGDGAVKAAVADHMKTLWSQLTTYLGGLQAPPGTAGGPLITTPPGGSPPAWDAKIESTHLLLPDEE